MKKVTPESLLADLCAANDHLVKVGCLEAIFAALVADSRMMNTALAEKVAVIAGTGTNQAIRDTALNSLRKIVWKRPDIADFIMSENLAAGTPEDERKSHALAQKIIRGLQQRPYNPLGWVVGKAAEVGFGILAFALGKKEEKRLIIQSIVPTLRSDADDLCTAVKRSLGLVRRRPRYPQARL